MGWNHMDPASIHVYWGSEGIRGMVSEYCTGDITSEHDVLCGVHVYLPQQQLEVWVSGSGMHDQLLAVAEGSVVNQIGLLISSLDKRLLI